MSRHVADRNQRRWNLASDVSGTLLCMLLGDGTLLVCFLGNPVTGGADVPRVGLWRANGRLTSVALTPATRRMIAYLAVPRETSFGALGTQGAADRVAGALAAPPPIRSAATVRSALKYKKTHEWRIRRELQTLLGSQGLEGHLVLGRGRVGLRDATSDVAVLVRAVRLEDWDTAETLARALGADRHGCIAWLSRAGWAPAIQLAVDEALEEIAARMPTGAAQLALPAGGATGRADLTPALSHNLALTEPSDASLWLPPPERQRARRHGSATLAIAALTIGVAILASGLWLGASPQRAPLAGVWPTGVLSDGALMANLSKGLPFSTGVPASKGDVLLLRTPVLVAASSQDRRAVQVGADLGAVSKERLDYTVRTTSNTPQSDSNIFVAPQQEGLRLRAIPGTTQLITRDGTVLHNLPDAAIGGVVKLEGLEPRREYFLDAEYRATATVEATPGAISYAGTLQCGPGLPSNSSVTRVAHGSIITCTAQLVNVGDTIIPAVAVYIASAPRRSTTGNPSSGISLYVWTKARAAEPAETTLVDPLDVQGGTRHEIQYVPHSTELLGADGRVESHEYTEDPQRTGTFIGALGPGPEAAVLYQFKIRVL